MTHPLSVLLLTFNAMNVGHYIDKGQHAWLLLNIIGMTINLYLAMGGTLTP